MNRILTYKASGVAVKVGDPVKTFRGESAIVQGWVEPRSAESTGRIVLRIGDETSWQYLYPSVIDAEWRDVKETEAMLNVMLLHSEDGQDYVHAILYPADWTEGKADELAVQSFEAGQAANPDEWSWEDFEPELVQRGFTIPNWHHGPTWDRSRRTEEGQ